MSHTSSFKRLDHEKKKILFDIGLSANPICDAPFWYLEVHITLLILLKIWFTM